MRGISIAAAVAAGAAWVLPAYAQPFDFANVVHKAKQLAAKPYKPPPPVPGYLTGLDYDQYRQVRFHPEHSLWRQSHSNFQIMLIAPGQYFRHSVKIHTVAADGIHTVPFDKSDFSWPDQKLADKIPSNLGYAGFKLTYPLNGPNTQNQFLVFAGASYFRGVARNESFGLSARGIAIDTGLPGGEEFPDFIEYWLVRPSPHAHVLRFYALLNGPSLTGAYRFLVFPGAPTRIEVKAALFLRKDVKLLGLAPLTSMFYYGANTPRPQREWRRAVHDSGGLLIHSGTGEWLWRPLINPMTLQMDYFQANSVQGFGLLQRNTGFGDYEDGESRYDTRPSAWVQPHQDWGNGSVVLVELPTDSETNDNIVAFWSPQQNATAGKRYDLDYSLRFGSPGIPGEPMAQARNTYVGMEQPPAGSSASSAYRVIVDFTGGALGKLPADAQVSPVITGLNGTQVLQHSMQRIPAIHAWRLSLLAAPANGGPLDLRAYLKSGQKTLSETWTYELPAKNRIAGR